MEEISKSNHFIKEEEGATDNDRKQKDNFNKQVCMYNAFFLLHSILNYNLYLIQSVILLKNPWNVSDVTAFLFYCCPECDNIKVASEDDFIQHAISNHENVS